MPMGAPAAGVVGMWAFCCALLLASQCSVAVAQGCPECDSTFQWAFGARGVPRTMTPTDFGARQTEAGHVQGHQVIIDSEHVYVVGTYTKGAMFSTVSGSAGDESKMDPSNPNTKRRIYPSNDEQMDCSDFRCTYNRIKAVAPSAYSGGHNITSSLGIREGTDEACFIAKYNNVSEDLEWVNRLDCSHRRKSQKRIAMATLPGPEVANKLFFVSGTYRVFNRTDNGTRNEYKPMFYSSDGSSTEIGAVVTRGAFLTAYDSAGIMQSIVSSSEPDATDAVFHKHATGVAFDKGEQFKCFVPSSIAVDSAQNVYIAGMEVQEEYSEGEYTLPGDHGNKIISTENPAGTSDVEEGGLSPYHDLPQNWATSSAAANPATHKPWKNWDWKYEQPGLDSALKSVGPSNMIVYKFTYDADAKTLTQAWGHVYGNVAGQLAATTGDSDARAITIDANDHIWLTGMFGGSETQFGGARVRNAGEVTFAVKLTDDTVDETTTTENLRGSAVVLRVNKDNGKVMATCGATYRYNWDDPASAKWHGSQPCITVVHSNLSLADGTTLQNANVNNGSFETEYNELPSSFETITLADGTTSTRPRTTYSTILGDVGDAIVADTVNNRLYVAGRVSALPSFTTDPGRSPPNNEKVRPEQGQIIEHVEGARNTDGTLRHEAKTFLLQLSLEAGNMGCVGGQGGSAGWVTYMGTGENHVDLTLLTATGNVAIGGAFRNSARFSAPAVSKLSPSRDGAIQGDWDSHGVTLSASKDVDGFVAKYTSGGSLISVDRIGGTQRDNREKSTGMPRDQVGGGGADRVIGVTSDARNNIVVTGFYTTDVVFGDHEHPKPLSLGSRSTNAAAMFVSGILSEAIDKNDATCLNKIVERDTLSMDYYQTEDDSKSPIVYFTGTGSDDIQFEGHFTGTEIRTIKVQIKDQAGGRDNDPGLLDPNDEDIYMYTMDLAGSTWEPLTTKLDLHWYPQLVEGPATSVGNTSVNLGDGIHCYWTSKIGHVKGDYWIVTYTPDGLDDITYGFNDVTTAGYAPWRIQSYEVFPYYIDVNADVSRMAISCTRHNVHGIEPEATGAIVHQVPLTFDATSDCYTSYRSSTWFGYGPLINAFDGNTSSSFGTYHNNGSTGIFITMDSAQTDPYVEINLPPSAETLADMMELKVYLTNASLKWSGIWDASTSAAVMTDAHLCYTGSSWSPSETLSIYCQGGRGDAIYLVATGNVTLSEFSAKKNDDLSSYTGLADGNPEFVFEIDSVCSTGCGTVGSETVDTFRWRLDTTNEAGVRTLGSWQDPLTAITPGVTLSLTTTGHTTTLTHTHNAHGIWFRVAAYVGHRVGDKFTIRVQGGIDNGNCEVLFWDTAIENFEFLRSREYYPGIKTNPHQVTCHSHGVTCRGLMDRRVTGLDLGKQGMNCNIGHAKCLWAGNQQALSNLTSLVLSHNNFPNAVIDVQPGALPALERFEMRKVTGMTEVPRNIRYFTKLRQLLLDRSKFEGYINWIQFATRGNALEVLNIAHNNFYGKIHNSWRKDNLPPTLKDVMINDNPNLGYTGRFRDHIREHGILECCGPNTYSLALSEFRNAESADQLLYDHYNLVKVHAFNTALTAPGRIAVVECSLDAVSPNAEVIRVVDGFGTRVWDGTTYALGAAAAVNYESQITVGGSYKGGAYAKFEVRVNSGSTDYEWRIEGASFVNASGHVADAFKTQARRSVAGTVLNPLGLHELGATFVDTDHSTSVQIQEHQDPGVYNVVHSGTTYAMKHITSSPFPTIGTTTLKAGQCTSPGVVELADGVQFENSLAYGILIHWGSGDFAPGSADADITMTLEVQGHKIVKINNSEPLFTIDRFGEYKLAASPSTGTAKCPDDLFKEEYGLVYGDFGTGNQFSCGSFRTAWSIANNPSFQDATTWQVPEPQVDVSKKPWELNFYPSFQLQVRYRSASSAEGKPFWGLHQWKHGGRPVVINYDTRYVTSSGLTNPTIILDGKEYGPLQWTDGSGEKCDSLNNDCTPRFSEGSFASGEAVYPGTCQEAETGRASGNLEMQLQRPAIIEWIHGRASESDAFNLYKEMQDLQTYGSTVREFVGGLVKIKAQNIKCTTKFWYFANPQMADVTVTERSVDSLNKLFKDCVNRFDNKIYHNNHQQMATNNYRGVNRASNTFLPKEEFPCATVIAPRLNTAVRADRDTSTNMHMNVNRQFERPTRPANLPDGSGVRDQMKHADEF